MRDQHQLRSGPQTEEGILIEPAHAIAEDTRETGSTPSSAADVGRSGALPSFIALTAPLLAVYAVCVVVPYAFADDYTFLGGLLQGGDTIVFAKTVRDGRPVEGLLTLLTFGHMHGIADLRYQRLGGILGLVLLAWLLSRALARAGLDRRLALLVPLLICLLPPAQVYAAWATAAYYPYAAALAGLAVVALERAAAHLSNRSRWWRAGVLWASAAGLWLAALAIYQPAAMVFWLFAAVVLFIPDRPLPAILKRLAVYLSTMGLLFVLDLALAKVVPPLLVAPGSIGAGRTQPVQDTPQKFQWFLSGPLVDALNLAKLVPSRPLAVAVATLMCAGLLLYVRGGIRVRLAKLVLALALLPLSYTPNLVVAEDWGTYRTQIALSALVALYLALGLLGGARVARTAWRARRVWGTGSVETAVSWLLAGALVVCALLAVRNVTLDFALPNHTEYTLLTRQLRDANLADARSVTVVECWRLDSTAAEIRYDEFGTPTCMITWAAPTMTYLALRDVAPASASLPVVAVSPDQITTVPPGSAVVNMHLLARYRSHPPAYIPFE